MSKHCPLIVLTTLVLLAPRLYAADTSDYGYGSGGGYAAETLDERVGKLEKKFSGQAMVDLVSRMDRLQSEVAKVHGKMEEMQHHLESLQKQQQTLYSDIEQRLSGMNSGVAGTPATDNGGEGEHAAAPPPHESASLATPSAANPDARQAAYQKGFGLLKDGKYDEAVKEFKAFLQHYPKGEYADSAQYWLGEALYVNRDFSGAREAFRKLIHDFPQNAKLADAQLKLGYIEYDLGDYAKARDALNSVVHNYAGTNAAKLAEKRLDKMKAEKH